MKIIEYDRAKALAYARKWAFSRNPAYYNFNELGGDCTNYASQCLFAGVGIMNFTLDLGWYYRSLRDRAAAWTGVEYFYNFLIGNLVGIGDGSGPFAEEVELNCLEIGDFVQFGRSTGDYYHTPVIVGFRGDMPLVAAHSYDVYARPLNTYAFDRIRGIHILGARTP